MMVTITVDCSCCTTYLEWKAKHPALAKHLQRAADSSLIHQVNPNEIVTVVVDGEEHQYRGTIRASTAAPKGPYVKRLQ